MRTSRIQTWYQNPTKHLILAQFSNSPWTTAAAFAQLQWSRIQEKPQFEPFDPSTEFLTAFVAANQGMHARGCSGAGAWLDRRPDGVWHPKLGLAGVWKGYVTRRKVLSRWRREQVARLSDDVAP